MSNDDRLLEARNRAHRAQSLLDDELIVEAFTTLEASYVRAWRMTGIHDEKGREKLFLAVNVLEKVRGHLKTLVQDGKIADHELKTLIEEQERKRRLGIF